MYNQKLKLENILNSHLSGAGEIRTLENKLEKFYGLRYALCVSSGTSGLLALALSLDLKKSDFITTPYTYGGTISSWLLLNNRPVFADIDPELLTIEPAMIEKRITNTTKAILTSDIYGIPCDMAEIKKIADKHGLWFISDSCQSFGAFRAGVPAGYLSDALVISFTSGKPLSAFEGGAVLTNNPGLYEKLLWYSQHPLRQRQELSLKLDNEFAMNGRMHPLTALYLNKTFEKNVRKIIRHRIKCNKLIDIANSSGYTHKINFAGKKIEPSFTKLTVALKSGKSPGSLEKFFKKSGYRVTLQEAPVRVIYNQPSFISQYKKFCPAGNAGCKAAEYQEKQRYSVLYRA